MAVAAAEARALRQTLAAAVSLDGLPRPYYQAAAVAVNTPWRITVGADLAFDFNKGKRPPLAGLIRWYMKRVRQATHTDQVVNVAFARVGGLVSPLSTLFKPAIVWRVLRSDSSGAAARVVTEMPELAAAAE